MVHEAQARLKRAPRWAWWVVLFSVLSARGLCGGPLDRDFVEKYCANCHNDVDLEGGIDLSGAKFDPASPTNFQLWVRVHDRIVAAEMPPKRKRQPGPSEVEEFLRGLRSGLGQYEADVAATQGRTTQRRLNRYEYENAVRDLLQMPWLQVKGELPEDGEAELFNKIGDVLDVSHVQMARYLRAANEAIRQAMAVELARQEMPPSTVKRYYAREEPGWTRTFKRVPDGNPLPDRMAFPVLGTRGQPEVRDLRAPLTVGEGDPATRELEAVGWMRSNYHAFNTVWDRFRAPVAGRYRVRWSGYTIWVGPNGFRTSTVMREGKKMLLNQEPQWYFPNGDDVSAGRRNEPISVYAQGPVDVRRVGMFDLTPEPAVYDLGELWLDANEALVTDATRFSRNIQGFAANPLAQRDGAPAVAFRWMEVEGPIFDGTETAGYRQLFGHLRLVKSKKGEIKVSALMSPSDRGGMAAGDYGRLIRTREESVEVIAEDPSKDAERLLRSFMARAYRRPVQEYEVQRYLGLVIGQLNAKHDFAYAMIAGYTAVLCSPGFLYLEEKPGRLDGHALSARLAFFLWNSAPDETLRALAATGELQRPEVLRQETERLLRDEKANRFVESFLDYWLDLRKSDSTTPSNSLYPDYYIDEALAEAALDESRLFFAALLRENLPARNVIASNFTYLNGRLAEHYGIAGVEGAAMRRVPLSSDSVRGGVLTQAMVLKVTANGTTTSPVIRGKWITERILGQHVSPPPSGTPAVDPDTRGAVTIRQQLEKHRNDPSCAVCHVKIDPPGFALENFDVMGGWRDRYRSDGKDGLPAVGIGKNGWPFAFSYAQPVDARGELPDGRTFNDIREFKKLILKDEPQIARNLVRQLIVYATSAPVRFSDREEVEKILRATQAQGFGVRDLVHAIVQSGLFQNK